MRRLAGLGAVFALAACAVGGTAGQVRYTGALPGCGLVAATLTRHGDSFVFTPGDGVLTIEGAIATDGKFAGTFNTQAPGKPAFLLTVQGRIENEQVTLSYVTPRCSAQATLSRVHPPLL